MDVDPVDPLGDTPMIQAENVWLRLGGSELLKGASLKLHRGEMGVLWGESGSGKSTLMRVLAGIYEPSQGEVRIAGLSPSPENLPAIRSCIAYLPQKARVADESAVREHLLLPFGFRANQDRPVPDDLQLQEWLNRFHLEPELLERPVRDLSGGEFQRVSVIRALMLGRTVLLLDEVTSAMDGANQERVLDAITQDPEITALVVSHDPRVKERGDRLFSMAQGRLEEVTDGS